jgi:hypothetical protein
MPDFINIAHPERLGPDSQEYRNNLEIKRLKAELEQLRVWYDMIEARLMSIFTRIERGDPVELHYPDGAVIRVARVEQS